MKELQTLIPLTPVQAYLAGREDFDRAIAIAHRLIAQGKVHRGNGKEARDLALMDLWQERVQRGELPEIVS